mgnify:CR=1 FL=1
MRKKYKILTILSIILIFIIIAIVIVVNQMNKGLEKLNAQEIPLIDLTSVEDGTYLGYYSIPLISVKVEVTVINHQITEIVILEHKNGQGKDGESIINDVINHQSIDIDFISGSTYSSKVILLAVGDALS